MDGRGSGAMMIARKAASGRCGEEAKKLEITLGAACFWREGGTKGMR